jgi:hypothetical protein
VGVAVVTILCLVIKRECLLTKREMMEDDKQRVLSRKKRVKKRGMLPYATLHLPGELAYDYAAAIASCSSTRKPVVSTAKGIISY